jgi:hypothetical protein
VDIREGERQTEPPYGEIAGELERLAREVPGEKNEGIKERLPEIESGGPEA